MPPSPKMSPSPKLPPDSSSARRVYISISPNRYLKPVLIVILILLPYWGYTIFNRIWQVKDMSAHLRPGESHRDGFSCCSVIDIAPINTPDPWIVQANNKFYLTFSGNTTVPMWEASSLLGLYDEKQRRQVYIAPPTGPQSSLLWAPELHCIRGRWYICFAAADQLYGNKGHRMYVLGGPPEGHDPYQGSWELLGAIKGMDQRQWAIDGTVFETDGKLYFVYSGWPRRDDYSNGWEDEVDFLQQLFILRLSDPTTAGSETVMISTPTEKWESWQDYGINEGPTWLESPTGHWRGLIYSCSAAWTKSYKMATLKYLGGDPLDPKAWQKSAKPLLQSRPDGTGPYGPGHGSFLNIGGNQTVAIFHAADRDDDDYEFEIRRARMQRLRWTSNGPDLGDYIGAHLRDET